MRKAKKRERQKREKREKRERRGKSKEKNKKGEREKEREREKKNNPSVIKPSPKTSRTEFGQQMRSNPLIEIRERI